MIGRRVGETFDSCMNFFKTTCFDVSRGIAQKICLDAKNDQKIGATQTLKNICSRMCKEAKRFEWKPKTDPCKT